jgi:hypothetical protein
MHSDPCCMVPTGPDVSPSALTALIGSLWHPERQVFTVGFMWRRTAIPPLDAEIRGPAVLLCGSTEPKMGCDQVAWCVTTPSMTTLMTGTGMIWLSDSPLALSLPPGRMASSCSVLALMKLLRGLCCKGGSIKHERLEACSRLQKSQGIMLAVEHQHAAGC